MRKAEIEAERDELLEALQEARCTIDRALGVAEGGEDDGEGEDEDDFESEDE